jgi:hypothetical protein
MKELAIEISNSLKFKRFNSRELDIVELSKFIKERLKEEKGITLEQKLIESILDYETEYMIENGFTK